MQIINIRAIQSNISTLNSKITNRCSSSGVSESFHVQTCIIGAGVIGLAIARELSKAGQEVLILERNAAIGAGELKI